KENRDLFIDFGGHEYAAGLTIQEKNIPEFKRRFLAAADRQLQEKDVKEKLYLDAEVGFKSITFDLIESLNLLEPYGHENPPPILYCEAMQTWPPKVVGKLHLKFFLEQEERALEGIGFNLAERKDQIRQKNIRLKIA